MAFKDMREFLAKLDEIGQLKHVKAPINVAQGTNELLIKICQEAGEWSMYVNPELPDIVPETTFRIPLERLTASMPMSWRALTGAIKTT